MGDGTRRAQASDPHVIPFPRPRRAHRRWRAGLVIGSGMVLALAPGILLVMAAHNVVQRTVLAFWWLALTSLLGWVVWLWRTG